MIGDSFKQQCPSCEAMVAVKNSGMIGKKMECPKCKDRFVVSKPAMQSSDEDDDADEAPVKRTPPRPAAAGKNAPSAKAKKAETYDVEDDDEPAPRSRPVVKKPLARPSDETRGAANYDEDDEKPAPAARKAVKPAAQDDDDEDDGVEIHFEPGAKKLLSKSKPQDDDDDDEPRAPTKKLPLKAKARNDDDDEDDEEDLKPAKAPPKKAPIKPRAEDDEDEDDEDRKPPKKALVKAKARPEPEDDEEIAEADDEDEKPASRKGPGKPKGKALPDDDDDDDEEDEVPRPGKKPPSRLKSKAKAKAKAAADDEDEDGSESESAPAKKSLIARLGLGSLFGGKAKANGVKSKDAKSKAKVSDEEEESASEEEKGDEKKKKKKVVKIFGFELDLKSLNLMAMKAGSRKTAIGVGLAVVGIMVLVYAAYLMLFNTGPDPHGKQPINPSGTQTAGTNKNLSGVTNAGKTGSTPGVIPLDKKTDNIVNGKTKEPDGAINPFLKPFDPSITNLLPADAEQVIHVNFANLFFQTPDSPSRGQLEPSQRAGPFYEAAFQSSPNEPGPFLANVMEKKLGFSPLKVDELVHAESFSAPWSFTVVHLKEKLDMKRLTAALRLGNSEKNPSLTNTKKVDVDFYRIPENAWLEQFARLAPGFAAGDRQKTPRRKDRPLFLHKHDAQTLVLADGPQMFNFLDGKIKKAGAPPAAGDPGTFTSLKSSDMKNMINRLEKKEPQDRFMFMSIVQVQQARWPSKKGELVQFFTRPILDVLPLMEERNTRLTHLGSSLFSREKKQPAQKYQYRTELKCSSAGEANYLLKDLKAGEPLRELLEQYVKVKFETAVFNVDPTPREKDKDKLLDKDKGVGFKPPDKAFDPKSKGPFDPKDKGPFDPKDKGKEKDKEIKKELPKKASQLSRAFLEYDEDMLISLILDLNLDPYDGEKPMKNLTDCLALLMTDAYGELALAEEEDTRPKLARAGNLLVTDSAQKWQARTAAKGKKLPLGQYPPAAFPYALRNGSMEHDPGRRVSWMVGLLPYLGRQGLYDRVTFNASWDDPVNWQAGRTLVPEFIDPRYPASSRYVDHPGTGQPFGATHFVGISGVGLDSGDPIVRAAEPFKCGIFGYDRSATLDEVSAGRGTTRTMLMIQVPQDSLPGFTFPGFTPWIAGGGSTLRGVPETDSIKPFLGKGEAGTTALMADGSVRFISSKISDRVFKAMATYQGEAPSDFEPELKSKTTVNFSPEK